MATQNRSKKRGARALVLATLGASVMVTTGFGVLASLNATASNVTAQSVNSGTLKLSLTDQGAGFSQAISNTAPGDVINRYVVLNNNGTLDAQALSFAVASTGSAALITDAVAPATTKALKVAVNQCSGIWATDTGICSGTVTPLLAATTIGSLSTAATLIPGAITSGQVINLQVQLSLPDQDETTVNGVLPTSTIQGATANFTYTFRQAQRLAKSTNS